MRKIYRKKLLDANVRERGNMSLRRTCAVLATLATCAFAPAASADAAVPRPATCGRLAVAVVIDRSGSMAGAPIDNAKLAAIGVVDKLGQDDCITVIAFDSSPSSIVALHPLTDPNVVKTQVAGIHAGGGTDLLSALVAAHTSLATATSATKKHVVLLTDGQSPVAGLQLLAQRMSMEHMTLSTIGFGTSIDEPTLRMLATAGNGRYYNVIDPTMLPRVFARDLDIVLSP